MAQLADTVTRWRPGSRAPLLVLSHDFATPWADDGVSEAEQLAGRTDRTVVTPIDGYAWDSPEEDLAGHVYAEHPPGTADAGRPNRARPGLWVAVVPQPDGPPLTLILRMDRPNDVANAIQVAETEQTWFRTFPPAATVQPTYPRLLTVPPGRTLVRF